MSSATGVRAVLMTADIKESGNGFHRLVFKVEGGRNRMFEVTVLISQDAHRKLLTQLSRMRAHPGDKMALLKTWARWAIGQRLGEQGVLPSTLTITASDLDEFGGYAAEVARAL